ncbi:pilus assembly protein PilV [Piscinibacter sp.]|jgi:type IV pilus assembly protein PilV|uniref:type IV pilus modification PilV family protein n=1 Tax=Piscinibacter sp. TaxID=1903157 RepID=UPI00355AC09D
MKHIHFRRPVVAHRKVGGFVLIEALVALLIFAFGVLGLVGLQVAMTKAQTSSKFRADAAFLASELIGTMWTDVPHIDSYASTGCSAYARCNSWTTKVASVLPSGTSAVTVVSGVVTISITWAQSGEATNKYTTTLAIQR